MVNWLLQKLIGTYHERERKRLWPTVEAISRLEPTIQPLSDAELRAKTDELRARLRASSASHTFITPSSPEWY
ncbi:MAG: hypothetical protein HYY90_05560, partial [Candidatus Omnitrophica bacterium]|nr:hypothetical protein [Candidatus Omnitrophota bacterium]